MQRYLVERDRERGLPQPSSRVKPPCSSQETDHPYTGPCPPPHGKLLQFFGSVTYHQKNNWPISRTSAESDFPSRWTTPMPTSRAKPSAARLSRQAVLRTGSGEGQVIKSSGTCMMGKRLCIWQPIGRAVKTRLPVTDQAGQGRSNQWLGHLLATYEVPDKDVDAQLAPHLSSLLCRLPINPPKTGFPRDIVRSNRLTMSAPIPPRQSSSNLRPPKRGVARDCLRPGAGIAAGKWAWASVWVCLDSLSFVTPG